jgi:hypothetical protein
VRGCGSAAKRRHVAQGVSHVRSYRASHIHVHILILILIARIIILIIIAVAIEARRRCDPVGLSRARSGIGHADAARAAAS